MSLVRRFLTLQRGRACEGAEITNDSAASVRAACFNGAAPVRARKSMVKASARAALSCFNGAAPVRARK